VDAARAVATENGVLIEDVRGASQIHSKGSHGTPRSGGGLSLSWVEAAYLAESNRLSIESKGEPMTLADVLERGAQSDERFEIRYLAYRDFRERGYVLREEPATAGIDFTVRARGQGAKSPSKFWIMAVSERSALSPRDVIDWALRAEGLGKKPLASVVDEEGDITHYEFATGLVKSEGHEKEGTPAAGVLLRDHVLVSGPDAHALHAAPESFGKPLRGLLRLSLIEAAYLCDAQRLEVREPQPGAKRVTAARLRALASDEQPDFALRAATYAAMKGLGLVPKTGFKYGVHFRVYEGTSAGKHAQFLVHCVEESYKCTWPELSRAVRLGHGVRKKFAYAVVSKGGEVRFLRARWTRP